MAYKSSQVDNLIALRLLKILVTPFEEFPAYQSGVIDENGKYIVPSSKRTFAQKKTLTYLDRLMINIKKIINKLPGGESKLKNLVAAMFLIKECQDKQDDGEMLTEQVLIDKIETVDFNNPSVQRIINMWQMYAKLREQCTSAAIAGSNSKVDNHVANNNTSGVEIYSTPLVPNIIRRKQEQQ